MKSRIACFLLLLPVFLGCTKDDICIPETAKTPLLIIRFYDNVNTEILKPVPNLTFKFEQDGAFFPLFEDPVSTDSIAIPLRTNGDITIYKFIKNSTVQIPDDDSLEFNYTRENEYINRACAFRTNFSNLTVSQDMSSPTSWIKNITLTTNIINAQNQNAAHINIYH